MILVDTSVWADHFRSVDAILRGQIERGEVVAHRLVIEELALGHLPQRARTLLMLRRLPELPMAEGNELFAFIEREKLAGTGIGLVDTHLLASAAEHRTKIWTRDKRLGAQAQRLGCAWAP